MDERKIEKQTQVVVFGMSDHREINGEVFLRLYEAQHTGRQKVGDLLNDQQLFIPVKTLQGPVLLNVSQIVTVTVGSGFEKDDLMILGKKYTVCIRTTQNIEIKGDIFVNLPEEVSRVKDYFNQSLQFFAIFQHSSIIYINRHFILSVQD